MRPIEKREEKSRKMGNGPHVVQTVRPEGRNKMGPIIGKITKISLTSESSRIFALAPNFALLASTRSYQHVLLKYVKKKGKTKGS